MARLTFPPLEFLGVQFWDVPGDEARILYGRASGQLGAAGALWQTAFFLESASNGEFFSTYQLNGIATDGDVPYVGRVLALGHGVRCSTADAELSSFVRGLVIVDRLDESGASAGLPAIPITGHQWASGNLPMLQGVQLEVLQGNGPPPLLPLTHPQVLLERHFRLVATYEHVMPGTLAADTHVEFFCAVALFPKPSETE